ncbi:MAG: GNAT family N-acetyltransferase [Leptolyngbyaceae cyanobacterium HOT.MB2.61]|jgi:Acetyltransferase (GNAT) family.|nr:GNAT family N-acetyltransferase [Leptolyngbyaceae cyanobacterium HOT.MB2.61]
MQIIDLTADNPLAIAQIVDFFIAGFQDRASEHFANRDSALEEIQDSFAPDRISRIAVDEDGTVLGWIGAIRSYEGHAWELHPLVVRSDRQRQGVGKTLVADLEEQVRQRGGSTIYIGTDDEAGETSLFGIDLYPNVWEHIAQIKNLRHHPYEFYQKQGYTIVGVIPDANGFGKPDILMAKRIKEKD